jgi:hypothetical protein
MACGCRQTKQTRSAPDVKDRPDVTKALFASALPAFQVEATGAPTRRFSSLMAAEHYARRRGGTVTKVD